MLIERSYTWNPTDRLGFHFTVSTLGDSVYEHNHSADQLLGSSSMETGRLSEILPVNFFRILYCTQ